MFSPSFGGVLSRIEDDLIARTVQLEGYRRRERARIAFLYFIALADLGDK
jgi:hypothetical protein